MNIFGEKEEETQNIYILQFNDNELLDKNTIADYDDILDNSNLILINRPATLSDISSIMDNYFSLEAMVKTQTQEQQIIKERLKKYEEEIEATKKEITELRANISNTDSATKKMTSKEALALYHANTDNQYD
jgi:septal ring factor EnvC (AmiA/AmiB activator)